MSETTQDTQPLEQIVERMQYHTPEFRDYGKLQDLTQTSQISSNTPDSVGDGVSGYVTGGVG